MGDVEDAVAACYRAFARYRFDGGALEADEGLGPLEQRLLRATPPAEVPQSLMMEYLASLPPAIAGGAVDDVRALLPRLFELAAEGTVPRALAHDIPARAGWPADWPEPEVEAVARFLAALARTEPGDGRAG